MLFLRSRAIRRLVLLKFISPNFPGIPTARAAKMFLPHYIERGLLNAGLRPDPAADARRDPNGVPNASSSTRPWVIHRFARPGVSPHICLQLAGAIKNANFDLFWFSFPKIQGNCSF